MNCRCVFKGTSEEKIQGKDKLILRCRDSEYREFYVSTVLGKWRNASREERKLMTEDALVRKVQAVMSSGMTMSMVCPVFWPNYQELIGIIRNCYELQGIAWNLKEFLGMDTSGLLAEADLGSEWEGVLAGRRMHSDPCRHRGIQEARTWRNSDPETRRPRDP